MKVLVFGGTYEGRLIAEAYVGGDKSRTECMHLCVATGYGATLLPEDERLILHHERMDETEMEEFMRLEGFDLCIDATHPYAWEVSRNIREACEACGLTLKRLRREDSAPSYCKDEEDILYFDTVKETADYLNGTKGNILITTGSKELAEFTCLEDYESRCHVRVLPTSGVVRTCEELGFKTANLYCMQGPFSKDMNLAMLKACRAEYLVTKESGSVGGFDDKVSAAREAGVRLVIIGRPAENEGETCSLEDILKILGLESCPQAVGDKKTVYLIGAGCGSPGQFTAEAIEALVRSDVIAGASRIIQDLEKACGEKQSILGIPIKRLIEDKKIFSGYDKKEIARYIRENCRSRAAILYSGDIGFFSGAAGICDELKDHDIVRIPGISSAVYFLDKLAMPWQDVRFLSCHGRELMPESLTGDDDRLLILLGNEDDAGRICTELCKLNLGNSTVYIGENLSYPDEKIISGTAAEMTDCITGRLAQMFICKKGSD